jgi:peptide/nickel transport system substrate-binding protein
MLFSGFVKEMAAKDDKTIVITLKEPTGQLLFGLAKPGSNVPFMMPKRVAETDPQKQISDFTGSGPFIFKADEWKPGDKAVYLKNTKYKPRAEPASGFSGGKVVNVDRVEWRAISDQQQALNALSSGEIDYMEQPPHDLLPLVKADANLKLIPYPYGAQFTMRLNSTQPPFTNAKIKQALWYALNQDDFMKAVVGDPEYYRGCKSFFPCGSPLSTTAGMDGLLSANAKKSQELLKEAGYDGTPIVLMASTDLAILTNLSPVAKQLMERGGFKVDMQSMDWQTLVARRAKKDAPNAGGWNMFHTVWANSDILNPVLTAFLNASCDKAAPGWPCDEQMEKLRGDYMRAPDLAAQKAAAEAVQKRAIEITTHIPLGEYFQPPAARKTLDNFVTAPAPLFWGITKK